MIQGTFITVIEFELYKICLNTFKFRIAIQKTSDRKTLYVSHCTLNIRVLNQN